MDDIESLLDQLGAEISAVLFPFPGIIKTIFKPFVSPSPSVVSISINGKKIELDRKLIEKIRNIPSVWSNPDIIEKIAQRYPGIDFREVKKAVESIP